MTDVDCHISDQQNSPIPRAVGCAGLIVPARQTVKYAYIEDPAPAGLEEFIAHLHQSVSEEIHTGYLPGTDPEYAPLSLHEQRMINLAACYVVEAPESGDIVRWALHAIAKIAKRPYFKIVGEHRAPRVSAAIELAPALVTNVDQGMLWLYSQPEWILVSAERIRAAAEARTVTRQ